MGLRKGQTNNPNGRPKGSPNKDTKEMRQWLKNFLDENREQIENDFKELEPHQRLQMFERLMQYTLPKMQSVNANIDLNNLSDDQLEAIVNEITKNV